MKTASSRESGLTVTRRSPAAASARALRASSAPSVVSANVLDPLDPGQHRDEPIQVEAQQRLAASQPQLAAAKAGKDPGEPGKLLEGEQVLAGQKREVAAEDVAGHAVGAAELASVGDRDPQVPPRACLRVSHWRCQPRALRSDHYDTVPARSRRRARDASSSVRPSGCPGGGSRRCRSQPARPVAVQRVATPASSLVTCSHKSSARTVWREFTLTATGHVRRRGV